MTFPPPNRLQNTLQWVTKLSDAKQSQVLEKFNENDYSRVVLERDHKYIRTAIQDLPSPSDIEARRFCVNCRMLKTEVESIEPQPGCFVHSEWIIPAEEEPNCDDCGRHIHEYTGCKRSAAHAFSPPSIPKGMFVVPAADLSKKRRALVMLDCEFYIVKYHNGTSKQTVGSIGMVDGLTGEVLLNNIVAQPDDHDISGYNFNYSPLSYSAMRRAVQKGTAIIGLAQLNEMMIQFIDLETIICGHAVHNDLQKMRLGVDKILDTQRLFANTSSQLIGLKTLVETKLPKNLIPSFQSSKLTHDAIEDAFATREVMLARAFRPDSGFSEQPAAYGEDTSTEW